MARHPGRTRARNTRRAGTSRPFQSRSDRMIAILLRVWHALKMGLLVAGVAMGSAALWYLVNAPDGRETEALLEALARGPVYANELEVPDWQVICLTAEEANPNAILAAEGAARTRECAGWNGSMKYFPGFGAIAVSGPSSCRIIPVLTEYVVPAAKGESACLRRAGLTSLHRTGAAPPYGLELRRN